MTPDWRGCQMVLHSVSISTKHGRDIRDSIFFFRPLAARPPPVLFFERPVGDLWLSPVHTSRLEFFFLFFVVLSERQ